MLAMTILLTWTALLVSGRTPTGAMLRGLLVDRPARWLERFTRGQVIVMAASLLFIALLFWIMEEEALHLAGMYAPELMGLAASVEFTAAIDALMVGIVTAGSLRLRGIGGWMRMRLPRLRVRAVRRARRKRRALPPANDDDRPGWVRAA